MTDPRLYQSVARRLRQRIERGDYAPGARLPGERELAKTFGVSRITVREAAIALQATGYITIKPGSGAYVAPRDAPLEGDVPQVSALELTQARLLLESEAAALAAQAIDAATLERLADLVRIMATAHPEQEETAQRADREFHMTIARAAGNAAVLHLVQQLWRMRFEQDDIRAAHRAVCSEDMAQERGREHQAILDALVERNPDTARAAMQAHFKRLLASMIDTSEALAVEEQREKAARSRARYLGTPSHANTG